MDQPRLGWVGAAAVTATFGLAVSTASAGPVTLFSAGFETTEGYTTGTLVTDFKIAANPGQQGWYATNEGWWGPDYLTGPSTNAQIVSTRRAHTGTQSLEMPADDFVYDLVNHDFARQSDGKLTAEFWYYLENVDSTSGNDSNNISMMLANVADVFASPGSGSSPASNGLVTEGFAIPYGSGVSATPDKLLYADSVAWNSKVTYAGISGAGEWKGLKVVLDIDNKLFDLHYRTDGTEWEQILAQKGWYPSSPDTVGTISLFQIASGGTFTTSYFNNPDYSSFIDDISITWGLGSDFDGDGDSDADDVDLMLANLTGANVYNEDYDLDGDFDADQDDLIRYIRDIMNTEFGDWNLDGAVDLADFNLWLGSDGTGGWAEGDGNGDGSNDLLDFNMWLGESPPTGPGVVLSPEPASVALLGLGGLLTLRRQRRTRR